MWVRICVWKLYIQPYVQNKKGNTMKFGREGTLMAFLSLPVEIIIEGDSCIYYCALISIIVDAVLGIFSILHAFISKDLTILIRSVEIILSF